MASPRSDPHALDFPDLADRLRESARRGDWREALALAALLPQQALPTTHDALREYLSSLHAALIAAKATRADLAASLSRLTAAATFSNAAADSASGRQKFVDPAHF